MKLLKKKLVLALLVAGLFISSNATATTIGFSVMDPTGDNTGLTDLIRLDFTLDNSTGDYSIDYFSSTENPFSGDFVLNANFENLTLGTSFFDNSNLFSLTSSSTRMQLSGTNELLKNWNAGDEIVYTKQGSYLSNVYTNIYQNPDLDIIGLYGTDFQQSQFSAILEPVQPVPEPGTLLLLGMGLLGATLWSRKRN